MLRLCAFALCLFLTASADSTANNHTIPLNDPDRPGCKQVFFWTTKITTTDFITVEQECSTKGANSRPLPFSALSSFADVFKKSVGSSDSGEYVFFVESDRGSFCAEAKMKARKTRKFFHLSTTALTTLNGFQCDKRKSVYTNKVVCYRVYCPAITTTSSTTTTIPVTVTTTEETVGALRIGSLGLPVTSEILMYQIVIGLLIFFLLFFLILLLRTCYQLRRANSRHVMSDGRSHVSIRRVTEAVMDPYSSMAGIAETSSLGGPEFYGSIARRKELTRERKAWLRDHACGGSHIGVPSPEDMNGLLPAGSIHRTSITSLTQPGGPRSINGPNGSLSRVPGMQAPPGTFPVRPSAYQLSRQNTTDSLHCRPMMTPQPMMLPPSPGANGHANPLSNRDEVEGHMV